MINIVTDAKTHTYNEVEIRKLNSTDMHKIQFDDIQIEKTLIIPKDQT